MFSSMSPPESALPFKFWVHGKAPNCFAFWFHAIFDWRTSRIPQICRILRTVSRIISRFPDLRIAGILAISWFLISTNCAAVAFVFMRQQYQPLRMLQANSTWKTAGEFPTA